MIARQSQKILLGPYRIKTGTRDGPLLQLGQKLLLSTGVIRTYLAHGWDLGKPPPPCRVHKRKSSLADFRSRLHRKPFPHGCPPRPNEGKLKRNDLFLEISLGRSGIWRPDGHWPLVSRATLFLRRPFFLRPFFDVCLDRVFGRCLAWRRKSVDHRRTGGISLQPARSHFHRRTLPADARCPRLLP